MLFPRVTDCHLPILHSWNLAQGCSEEHSGLSTQNPYICSWMGCIQRGNTGSLWLSKAWPLVGWTLTDYTVRNAPAEPIDPFKYFQMEFSRFQNNPWIFSMPAEEYPISHKTLLCTSTTVASLSLRRNRSVSPLYRFCPSLLQDSSWWTGERWVCFFWAL